MAFCRFLLTLWLLALPTLTLAQSHDPLAGAWEAVAEKNIETGIVTKAGEARDFTAGTPGRIIFADGHYITFAAAKDRAKLTIAPSDMTKEQILDRFRLAGQYGTYTIKGGKTLVRSIVSAQNPTNEGQEIVSEFKVEGEVLTLTGSLTGSGPNASVRVERTYRRLRATP